MRSQKWKMPQLESETAVGINLKENPERKKEKLPFFGHNSASTPPLIAHAFFHSHSPPCSISTNNRRIKKSKRKTKVKTSSRHTVATGTTIVKK